MLEKNCIFGQKLSSAKSESFVQLFHCKYFWQNWMREPYILPVKLRSRKRFYLPSAFVDFTFTEEGDFTENFWNMQEGITKKLADCVFGSREMWGYHRIIGFDVLKKRCSCAKFFLELTFFKIFGMCQLVVKFCVEHFLSHYAEKHRIGLLVYKKSGFQKFLVVKGRLSRLESGKLSQFWKSSF